MGFKIKSNEIKVFDNNGEFTTVNMFHENGVGGSVDESVITEINNRIDEIVVTDGNVTENTRIEIAEGDQGIELATEDELDAVKEETASLKEDTTSLNKDVTNARGTDEQWSSSKSYVVNNYVIYDNALWRCVLAHSGQTPSEGTYWTKVDIKSLSNIVYQDKEKMGSTLYGLMRNGYCTNLDNANTVFSIVNYWDSALAHAPTIGSGFAILITVWSHANAIGNLTTPRIQMLMHENGIAYSRFYESSWSSWTKN